MQALSDRLASTRDTPQGMVELADGRLKIIEKYHRMESYAPVAVMKGFEEQWMFPRLRLLIQKYMVPPSIMSTKDGRTKWSLELIHMINRVDKIMDLLNGAMFLFNLVVENVHEGIVSWYNDEWLKIKDALLDMGRNTNYFADLLKFVDRMVAITMKLLVCFKRALMLANRLKQLGVTLSKGDEGAEMPAWFDESVHDPEKVKAAFEQLAQLMLLLESVDDQVVALLSQFSSNGEEGLHEIFNAALNVWPRPGENALAARKRDNLELSTEIAKKNLQSNAVELDAITKKVEAARADLLERKKTNRTMGVLKAREGV